MNDNAQTRFDVALRQTTLATEVALETVGERAFLPLQEPAPVGSVLELHAVNGDRQAFIVESVIETVSEGAEGKTGCLGRCAGADELTTAGEVGSETWGPAGTRNDPESGPPAERAAQQAEPSVETTEDNSQDAPKPSGKSKRRKGRKRT